MLNETKTVMTCPRGSAVPALPTSLIFRVVLPLPVLSPAASSRLVPRPFLLDALARASLLHVDRNDHRHQRQAWGINNEKNPPWLGRLRRPAERLAWSWWHFQPCK